MKRIYRSFFKRAFDLILSFLALILTSPILLITAILVKLDSKGPVLFKQERIGKGGRVFRILKFRSMVVNAEHTGSGVYSGKDDKRVTRVGRFLRATSLDELPQVINILRGDMSLIGPRPPLTYHPWPIGEYTDEQRRMFDVRPGITGWAQVNGRKEVEWHKRIELNVWYVDHVSFLLDVKIFFMTIFKVLRNADNVNVGSTVAPDGAAADAAEPTTGQIPVEDAAEPAAETVAETAAETDAPTETAEEETVPSNL